MRELKFRAWDKELKRMYSNISFDNNTRLPGQIKSPDIDSLTFVTKSRCEIMQYTGLKDKKGKGIYEGDLLKIKDDKPLIKVVWNKKYASFCLEHEVWMFSHWFGEAIDPDECEVVGNIYENPELDIEQI